MSLQLMIRYSDGDGGFHLLVAVAGGWDMWRDIIMDGFAASIGNDAERAYAFVFFVGGILLLLGVHCSIISVRSRSLCPCSWGIACCWCRL